MPTRNELDGYRATTDADAYAPEGMLCGAVGPPDHVHRCGEAASHASDHYCGDCEHGYMWPRTPPDPRGPRTVSEGETK